MVSNRRRGRIVSTFGEFTRLQETLGWVREHSPFYRERLSAAARIDEYEAFRAQVPRTTKTEVASEQRSAPPYGRLLAVPLSQVSLVHTSPGPIYIPRTAEERGGTPVLGHALETIGVRRGDVAHVTLSYHVMPGGLRLHRAFEEHGCIVINGGTGSSELQVQIAQELGATVYAGTPSFFANLLDSARTLGLDPRRDLRYRIGFSTAQALTPALRSELEAGFGVELFDHCGEALIGPVAGECRAHRGMHLHRGELFLEFLDPESGKPVAEGEVGEVVATHLGRRALPLVRYAPGDAYRLLAGDCPCGDPSPRVEFVGQVGVIRKVKGVLVHPAQVARLLAEFPEAGRFQIVVDRPEGQRYERATLRIALRDRLAREDDAEWRRRVAEQVKQQILLQMDIECCEEAAIPETAAAPTFKDAIVDRTHS
jgi:phenylacetate-CoA ligase